MFFLQRDWNSIELSVKVLQLNLQHTVDTVWLPHHLQLDNQVAGMNRLQSLTDERYKYLHEWVVLPPIARRNRSS